MRLAVIGGGLLGCACARAAKKLGFDVVLLESRQTLGAEITAAGQEWLSCGKSETSIQIGAVGKTLLSQQLELGTKVLLNAHAAAIAVNGKRAAGVVAATSFGTHIIDCDFVIDTIGLIYADIKTQEIEYRYNFAISNIAPLYTSAIDIPKSFCISNNCVLMHPSSRPDCAVAQIRFRKTVEAIDIYNPQRALADTQMLAAEVFCHLSAVHPSFKDAKIHELMHNELTLHGIEKKQMKEISGYHVLAASLPDPLSASSLMDMYDDIAYELSAACKDLSPAEKPLTIVLKNACLDIASCTPYTDHAVDFRNGLKLNSIKFPSQFIPAREKVSVLTAGGGTSGIQSVIALAEKGINTAMVDLCAAVGGTRSLGMVMSYWHGHKKGLNAKIDEAVHEMSRYYKIGENASEMLVHSVASKSLADHFYFNSIICGADTDRRNVKSLYMCDFSGLYKIEADVFIDATGDGTAARFCGADYELGDKRDGNIQTYSTWGENLWKRSNFMENRFHGDHDMADMDSYEDLLRCMYLGQYDNSDTRYSPIMTVRESRRIIGDHVLTLDEIWNEKIFDDTICVTLTPFDFHGKGSSIFDDMELAKFEGKEQRARIPYGCYIVSALDNMLITAKAFSSTRDANSIARMNPDLRHAGYAVGLCAAQSIVQKTDIRSIDIKKVQCELLQQGILPKWTFSEIETPPLEKLLSQTESGDIESTLILYRTNDKSIIDAIEKFYKEHSESDIMLCLCAWHNIPNAYNAAYERLIQILISSKAQPEESISEYDTALRLMGALVYNNQMTTKELIQIIDLSCAGGKCYYPKDHRYTGTIYGYERIDGWKVPHFKFLYLLAQAVERRPSKELASPMEALLMREHLNGYLLKDGKAEEGTALSHGIPPVFGALLELRLSAAAARCGSDHGTERLRQYARDDRSLMRKFAISELSQIEASKDICPYTGPFTLN